jgi:D-alanine-D-alanine ligase
VNQDETTEPLTRFRIGVLMGGQSAERDVSLKTGEAVYGALLRRGYDAMLIDVGPSLYKDLMDRDVKIAFLALHGPGGEDGSIQGFLESIRIPYTGSGVRASAMGMHKEVTKTLLAVHGIPVPAGLVLRRTAVPSCAKALKSAKLTLPVVVKPASQGSTIGVTIVRTVSQWKDAIAVAHRYDDEAMVEAYVPGHEVTVGVVVGKDGRIRAFPPVEIVAPDGFYDFSAKYQKGRTRYLCPAPLPAGTIRMLKELALKTYRVLGCDGAARVDFRITPKGKAYVLEINTVPGMTETSLLPMAAARAGVRYDDLVELILESALARVEREPFRTRG